MAERSPQHIEAMERWHAKVGTWQKLASVLVVLALTELFLWIFGADTLSPSASWKSPLIGGGCAIIVGWFVFPGSRYSWSRVTYNGRTALSEIRRLREELSKGAEGIVPLPQESLDRERLSDPVRFALATVLLTGDDLYKKIDQFESALTPGDIDDAIKWNKDLEDLVRVQIDVDAVAELRVYRRGTRSVYGAHFPSSADPRSFDAITRMRRYLDWIEDKLRAARI